MTNWKRKLEALMEGLHIVDQDKFIEQAEVGDYRKLGKMIYENGGAKNRRISLLGRLSAERRKQEKRLAGDALTRFQASYADALKFSASLRTCPSPNLVATADDGEIVFEWYGENHHLVVSIDGDGEYGYSYEFKGEVVAGSHEGFCDQEIPEDMRSYIEELEDAINAIDHIKQPLHSSISQITKVSNDE